MSEVPYNTKEWVGNQSIKYFNLIALEKSDYLEFGEKIKSFGKKILDDAQSIDTQIKNNENIGGN